jgi:hypothetical protein
VGSNRREFIRGIAGAGLAAGRLASLGSEADSADASGGQSAAGPAPQRGSGATDTSAAAASKDRAPDLRLVPYCGLYCGLCENVARIPKLSEELLKALTDFGWESFGDADMKHLIATLRRLRGGITDLGGCRGGKCGNPGCQMRTCAQQRGLTVCSSCADYPCAPIEQMAREYPLLLADGQRQKEVGLTRWVEEQEVRVRTGFCYCDVKPSGQ